MFVNVCVTERGWMSDCVCVCVCEGVRVFGSDCEGVPECANV